MTYFVPIKKNVLGIVQNLCLNILTYIIIYHILMIIPYDILLYLVEEPWDLHIMES